MSAKFGPSEQGRLQGAIAAIASLTSIAASIALTQLFAWSIGPGRAPAWSGVTMLLAAGCLVAALVVVSVGSGRDRGAGGTPPSNLILGTDAYG